MTLRKTRWMSGWVSPHGQDLWGPLPTVGRMKIFAQLSDLAACVGQHVATSEWVLITQDQVNRFADATGDHQWIHVDAARIAKERERLQQDQSQR